VFYFCFISRCANVRNKTWNKIVLFQFLQGAMSISPWGWKWDEQRADKVGAGVVQNFWHFWHILPIVLVNSSITHFYSVNCCVLLLCKTTLLYTTEIRCNILNFSSASGVGLPPAQKVALRIAGLGLPLRQWCSGIRGHKCTKRRQRELRDM